MKIKVIWPGKIIKWEGKTAKMYIFDILFAVDFGNDMSQKQSYAKQNKGKKHLLFFFFPPVFLHIWNAD